MRKIQLEPPIPIPDPNMLVNQQGSQASTRCEIAIAETSRHLGLEFIKRLTISLFHDHGIAHEEVLPAAVRSMNQIVRHRPFRRFGSTLFRPTPG